MIRPLLRNISLLLLLISAAPGSWAETLLFEAIYKGKYSKVNITTERRLVQLDDGTYELSSSASNLFGSLTETSHFRKDGDTWYPLTYTYRRKILGVSARETIEYDWAKGTARYTHSRKSRLNSTHQLEPGILDPALYQLRMQRDLVLGQDTFDYHFVKRDRIRHFVIETSPGEDLQLDKNAFATIKLERANGDGEKNTYVWAIPKLHYLFGRIVHVEDDGDEHQMFLNGYRVNQDPLLRFFDKVPLADTASAGD